MPSVHGKLARGVPGDVGMDAGRLRLLKARAQSWVDQGLTQALVYIVARRGVVVAEEALGRLAHRHDAPAVRMDSIFSIASVSKLITATATLMLVEDGLLSLNRPLVEYIPELRGHRCGRIFVHHLLTHTSGFHATDATRLVHTAKGMKVTGPCPPNQHPEIHRQLNACYGLKPADFPGTVSNYCGANYLFLGELVRRLSGKSLSLFAEERIFTPLGMTSTDFGLRGKDLSRRVAPDPKIYRHFPRHDPNDPMRLDTPSPAGGVYSTARDLTAFCQMFLNRGWWRNRMVLSPASVRLMTTNQIPGIGAFDSRGRWVNETCWGFGWMVQGPHHFNRWMYSHGTLPSVGTFYHEGASGAGVWVDPGNELVGVFLSVIQALDPKTAEHQWEFDRFQNMVTACVSDRVG